MTEFEAAAQGKLTEVMARLAEEESWEPAKLAAAVAAGHAVVVGDLGGKKRPVAVGGGLPVKVNANVGTSTAASDTELEARKAALSASLGARMISDCSVGGDLDLARRALLGSCDLPVATVPVYQASVEAGGADKINMDGFLEVVEKQLRDGAQLLVIHAALDQTTLTTVKARAMGMVSRGGVLTSRWMEAKGHEQALEDRLDDLLDLLRAHDAVLVTGNSARSGCVHDRLDEGHKREALRNEEIAVRANEVGVQVIVEAVGGHVHIGDIADHVGVYKGPGNRPLFAAGPLPVDVAMGYDHLAATVGGSLAAGAGADLLCYITPAEHLTLPDLDDVREGTIAALVSAYCGDAMRRGPQDRDLALSQARRRFDWASQIELSLAPDRAKERHQPGEGCSMCGDFCPMRDGER